MLTENCCLKFARGHRLQHDKIRKLWLIQAPEKAFIVDEVAAAILGLVDGQRSIKMIIDVLAGRYEADRDVMTRDVLVLLSDLKSKGVLTL